MLQALFAALLADVGAAPPESRGKLDFRRTKPGPWALGECVSEARTTHHAGRMVLPLRLTERLIPTRAPVKISQGQISQGQADRRCCPQPAWISCPSSPTGSPDDLAEFRDEVDDVVCATTPEPFFSGGPGTLEQVAGLAAAWLVASWTAERHEIA